MSTLRHVDWSTSGLIASIQRNALLPANQMTFQPADFMAFMNEVLQSTVVPFVLGLDSGYFLKTAMIPIISSTSTAFTIGSTGSSGDNVAYQLPADAIGKKLVDVGVVRNNGRFVKLPLVTSYQVGSPATGAYGCYVEGDVLYLYPAMQFNSIQTVQIIYPAAPLALCDDTGVPSTGQPSSAQVASINYTTGVVTLVGVCPTSFVTSAEVNFVSGSPQFRTLADSLISAVSGLTITVDPTVLTDSYARATVVPGDWVANTGYSPFLQLPVEGRNLVTQASVVKLLRAMKDDGYKVAKEDYIEMEKSAIKIFTPRVNDSPKTLSSYNQGVGAYRRFRF